MSQAEEYAGGRVYCAGPLFNRSERGEMSAIADCLEASGFRVFLPHRDGMEFRLQIELLVGRGWSREVAGQFLHSAIFALDIFQLSEECEAMVWNLNGRTPDEGAVSEAAIAWTLGKPLVAHTDDARSLIDGRLNPLLSGLVDFETVDDIAKIPDALNRAIQQSDKLKANSTLPAKVRRTIEAGRQLWNTLCRHDALKDGERVADAVEELFGPAKEPSVGP